MVLPHVLPNSITESKAVTDIEVEREPAEPNKVPDVVETSYKEERSTLKSVHKTVTYSASVRDNVDPNNVSGIEGNAIDLELLSTHHDPSRLGHDLNCTGLSLWFGSENICDYLLKMGSAKLKGLNVLELGCGVGLAGICASKLVGLTGKVILTDIDTEVLALVEANISKNADCNVDAPCFTWQLPFGDQVEEAQILQCFHLEHFDLIIAADVIYEGDGWQIRPLMETISRLLAPNGVFVLAFTKRLVSEELILERAEQNGLEWTVVDGYNYDIFGLSFLFTLLIPLKNKSSVYSVSLPCAALLFFGTTQKQHGNAYPNVVCLFTF